MSALYFSRRRDQASSLPARHCFTSRSSLGTSDGLLATLVMKLFLAMFRMCCGRRYPNANRRRQAITQSVPVRLGLTTSGGRLLPILPALLPEKTCPTNKVFTRLVGDACDGTGNNGRCGAPDLLSASTGAPLEPVWLNTVLARPSLSRARRMIPTSFIALPLAQPRRGPHANQSHARWPSRATHSGRRCGTPVASGELGFQRRAHAHRQRQRPRSARSVELFVERG